MMGIGSAINSFSIDESGDFSLSGLNGSAATQVEFGLIVASVKVLEIDGVTLGAPVSLGPQSTTGQEDLLSSPGLSQPWLLSLSYDVDAALTAKQLSYTYGATKLAIVLDNTLVASSELILTDLGNGSTSQTATSAFIAKKDFVINGETTAIPEPSSLALLSIVACGAGAIRRRRR